MDLATNIRGKAMKLFQIHYLNFTQFIVLIENDSLCIKCRQFFTPLNIQGN